jgi:hypothetical protein
VFRSGGVRELHLLYIGTKGGRKILLPKGRNTISIVVDDERFILEYYEDGEERNWTLCERAP